MASSGSIQASVDSEDQYLLLADISGFTAFLASVEQAHGVDFDTGLPAGFGVLGALLGAVIEGVEPDFTVAKLEGDAVFAVAPATDLDAHGDETLARLRAIYGAFLERREERARNARDHVCDACPVVATLDLYDDVKSLVHDVQDQLDTLRKSPHTPRVDAAVASLEADLARARRVFGFADVVRTVVAYFDDARRRLAELASAEKSAAADPETLARNPVLAGMQRSIAAGLDRRRAHFPDLYPEDAP